MCNIVYPEKEKFIQNYWWETCRARPFHEGDFKEGSVLLGYDITHRVFDSWRFEGTTSLRNTGNRLLSDAASYPTRPNSQPYCCTTLKTGAVCAILRKFVREKNRALAATIVLDIRNSNP